MEELDTGVSCDGSQDDDSEIEETVFKMISI